MISDFTHQGSRPLDFLTLPHFRLLHDNDLEQLRPVLETILPRRTEVVHNWYRLYALHFGGRRSLPESEFVHVFESALDHSLTALVEGNLGKFASEVIGVGELLVQRRMPLAEAIASLRLLEELVQALLPGQASISFAACTAFGRLSYVQVILLTTAYFSSQVAAAGERIEALERAAVHLPASSRTRFKGLVGASPAMRELYQRIETVAESRGTVLIMGESGTGKGLVARAIHECSCRAREQFVVLNSKALPEDLIESELFGYKDSAAGSADNDYLGIFRSANGGMVFVEEITAIAFETQSKLVRALEEGSVRPVGSTREYPVDVRIIASTSRNPAEAVASLRLRPELYAYLRTSMIEVPPLRQRREDIPLLVEHFMALLNRSFGGAGLGIRPEALQAMMDYSWPGNVRELAHVLEAVRTSGDAQLILLEDVLPMIGRAKVLQPQQVPHANNS